MRASLSFEQAPPIWVPFRFFLSAPLFAAAAGVLLALEGAAVLDSRWQGSTIALTHLLTLGVVLMSMCGAMLQLLPVAAGVSIGRPRAVAAVGHLGLTAGSLLLVAGFLTGSGQSLRLAAVLLGVSLAVFLAAVLIGIVRSPAVGATIRSLRLALAGFVATVGLGVLLSAAFGWQLPLDLVSLTSVHVAWSLLGWSLLLLAAVAHLVVPMFQLTPPYPAFFGRAWPWALFALCVAWTLAELGLLPGRTLWGVALAGCAAAFALATLRLQGKRRRRIADTTLLYWRVAMLALLAAAAAGAMRLVLPPGELAGQLEMLTGVLAIAGVLVPAIFGMLYKIVPFVTWLHLQRVLKAPPNMNELIPERRMRGQFWLYLAALTALVAMVMLPALALVAGLLLAGSSLWLQANLLRAVTMYLRLRDGGGERPPVRAGTSRV